MNYNTEIRYAAQLAGCVLLKMQKYFDVALNIFEISGG